MEASATAMQDGAGAPGTALPNARLSHTCVTCRARKVRCDGRRAICSNCERLDFTCTYDDGSPATGPDAGGTMAPLRTDAGDDGSLVPRRRARQACHHCHARKARCSGGLPKCARCQTLGIDCVYRPGRRSRIRSTSGSANGGTADPTETDALEAEAGTRGGGGGGGGAAAAAITSSGRDNDDGCGDGDGDGPPRLPVDVLESMALKTFDHFFGHLHHIPTFAFLHRASLMQRFHAGLVDRSLLLALVGITSLMTDLGPGTRSLGTRCIAEAEALVLARLERPSTVVLQTLVFVIHHRLLAGRFSSAFVLYGLASRFASALRLDRENPRLCFLACESRRRLMWALYMMDVCMASREIDLSLWVYKTDTISIQLPCNERNYEFDLPEKSEPLRPPDPPAGCPLPPLPEHAGFLALHVRILFVRSRILQFTQRGLDDVATVPARAAELAGVLEDFAARLPTSFRWSEANVRLRTYSPRLCVFVMTHIWWEHCYCELYCFALPGLREALPADGAAQLDAQNPDVLRHCRHQVYQHAMAMADMFRLLLSLDSGVPVTDLDLPMCLYQCARLLHYFGRQPFDGQPFGDAAALQPQTADSIEVCTRVLERCIQTTATQRIRASLDKLLSPELAAQTAPSVTGNPNPNLPDVDMDELAAESFQPQTAYLGLAETPTPSAAAAAPLSFDSQMPVATVVEAASDVLPPVPAQNALDAFDLDMESFGPSDFTGWLANSWSATDPSVVW